MLILLRILFGAALLYEMIQGAKSAPGTVDRAGDLTGAFYLVVCVGLGILNALVWAPYFGAAVSGPITGMITESTYVERTNWLLRWIHRLEARSCRRATVALCFWEAVRHPTVPAAFVIGLRNARPGSWFEKVYAREVFRFSNTQNCVQAYLALKRHGIDPRPHSTQEVNIVLLSLERAPRPEAEIVAVPKAPRAAPLKRNPCIRLFKQAEAAAEGEAAAGDRETAPSSEQRQPALDSASETALEAADSPESEGVLAPARRPQFQWLSNILARVMAFIRAN